MTSDYSYTPPTPRTTQTISFGAHRHPDRPASAVRGGASSMPDAFRSHKQSERALLTGQSEPERSLLAHALHALSWPYRTPRRGWMSLGVLSVAIVAIAL